MKQGLCSVAIVAILAAGVAFGSETAERRTLNGEFQWNHRNGGDLEAVFTEVETGKYTVEFHFEFRGKDHVYSGTAQGSLTEGSLEGEVQNEDKRRTFTFTGTFEDGKLQASHAELVEGKSHDTGTMTLE